MTARSRARLLGVAAVLAAAVLWGSIGVLSVGLFRIGVTPWEVAFWRAALAAALLGAWTLLRRPAVLRPARPVDAFLLAAYGFVAVGLFYISFQLAIAMTSVAVAVVLLYTAPAWVMLGARLLFGELLTGAKLAAAAVVVVGVWAATLGAVGADVHVTPVGVTWGLVAALSYATYYLFGKRYVPRLGVLRTLLFSLVAGAAALWPAATLAGHPPRLAMPGAAWALLLALALGTTLLANTLYYWSLTHLEAGRAAILASVEPVVAALLALAVLRQGLTSLGWVGVGLVVVGVAAAARTPRGGSSSAPAAADGPPGPSAGYVSGRQPTRNQGADG